MADKIDAKQNADGSVTFTNPTTKATVTMSKDEFQKWMVDNAKTLTGELGDAAKEGAGIVGDNLANGMTGLGNAVNGGIIAQLTGLVSTVSDPAFWTRVLLFALGAGLCIVGFAMIISSSNTAQGIAKTAVGLASPVGKVGKVASLVR